MIRLFIAIDLSKEQQRLIGKLRGKPPHGCRWTRLDQLHLTLRFLGDVDESEIPTLIQQLGAVRLCEFELQFSGTEFFPNERDPRVFCLEFAPAEPLFQLQRDVNQACVLCGLSEDEKTFVPHVTIARLKHGFHSHRNVPVLHERFSSICGHSFVVSRYHVYASTLSGTGAVHESLQVFPCI
ncbi:2'-5' RNA ligase [bacterium M21]|nr:2'-5' RNA ligase [bacterium M21]